MQHRKLLSRIPAALAIAVGGTALSAENTPEILNLKDLVFVAAAGTPQRNRSGNLECMGEIKPLSGVSAPLVGQDASGAREVKHAWVPESPTSARLVSYFAIRDTDPDTAGSGNKRCEYSYTGEGRWVPWERDFWFGVSVKTSNLSGTYDQQIVWQWHDGSRTQGVSPYIAAVVSGNQLSIQIRHNANKLFSQANTSFIKLYSTDSWRADTWYKFVVKARLNLNNNDSSHLKIWLNDMLIADYTGPLGYLYSSPKDYVKVGLYHWTNAGNDWNPAVPKREAWIKGPVMLYDGPGYDQHTIGALLR